MWKYEKMLQYPINIKKRDLKMANLINSQYGGPQGELAAAIRYLNQSFTMPDDAGKALLTDIGTEELGHVEMLQTMIKQLTKGATPEEIDELTKPQPHEPTVEERLAQTEELLQTVTMAFTEYVFTQDMSDDS